MALLCNIIRAELLPGLLSFWWLGLQPQRRQHRVNSSSRLASVRAQL